VMKTLRGRDRDAIAQAQKAYHELLAPIHEIMRKSQSDLTDVLTPEQKGALHDYQLMTAVRSMVAPVQLSEEQIQHLKAAYKEGDIEGFGGKLYPAIQQVLTPEQKAAIAKHGVMSRVRLAFAPARLTADQMKQAEAAYDELAKDQTVIDGKLHAKLTEKVNELLTDRQKEAMKRARRPWGGPGGVPGRPAPGAPIGGATKAPEKQQ
jgi:hypothetical protein